ncbi:MAG: tetratricopeptide repeat protein [Pirellulales bacterium]|nr:tetratricopeptide repeat protein [Pirellulales bacterium]
MSTVSDTLKLALRHHEIGQLQQAEELYREALRIDPQHPHGLHLLGVACHQQGKNQEAVGYFDLAIPLAEPTAEIYNNRAAARLSAGQIDEAIEDCRRALEINPHYFLAHNNLAHALNELERYEEAEQSCRRAMDLERESAAVHLNLGRALKGQGKLAEAFESYQQAAVLDPGKAETFNNLGNIYRQDDKLDEAVAAYEEALRIKPDYVEAINNLGRALNRQEKNDEALACFHRALELKPDFVPVLASLAGYHEKANQLEEALDYIDRGRKIAPEHPRLNIVQAKCEGRRGDFAGAVARIERVVAAAGDRLAEETRAEAYFQLGRFYDRMEEADKAFHWFQEGNRLADAKATRLGVDRETIHSEDRIAAELFHPAWIESWTPAPPYPREETPVFMTGFPRSGTTLIDQILDTHPKLQTMEERPTIGELKREILSYGSPSAWTLASLMPEHFDHLRAVYFRTVNRFLQHQPGLLLIDRNPFMARDAALAHRIFPDTRFIFVVRHPCDVCLSCLMQNFGMHSGTVNFFTLENTAAFYDEVMRLWQHYVRVLPIDYHMIRYEDLLDDFEGETRRLLDYLGVGWDESVYRHTEHAKTRNVRTASYHQVVEPLYRRARYRWQRYAKQLAPVMDVLRPYIEYYGYDGVDG